MRALSQTGLVTPAVVYLLVGYLTVHLALTAHGPGAEPAASPAPPSSSVLIGVFTLQAAVLDDPRQTKGLDATFRTESTDSGVEVGQVDLGLARELADTFGWPEPGKYDDRWRERGLLNESGNLTIAGVLVLTDPESRLQAAKFRVDVRVYESDTGTSYINHELVTGPPSVRSRRRSNLSRASWALSW